MTTTTGYGQQSPYDSTSEFSVDSFIVRQMMAQLDTMKPCKVTAVHPGAGSPPIAGTVDVQLLISQVDGAGNVVKQGVVYGIPYTRIQGGPWSIVCDPGVGDFGWLSSADRDISALKSAVAQGQSPTNVNPGSNRKYHVSDAVYVGGAFNPTVTKAWIWLKADGTLQIQDELGNVVQSSSAGFVFTPVSGGVFKVNGAIEATGDVIAGLGSAQVSLLTHLQMDGGGVGLSGPPEPGT
jgi:hypothetical protein